MVGNKGVFTFWGDGGVAFSAEASPFSDLGKITLWGDGGLALSASDSIDPDTTLGEFTLWGDSGLALGGEVVFGAGLAEDNFASINIVLSMVPQAEEITLDLELVMYEYGDANMQLELQMFDPSFVNANPLCWSVRVLLDAVDVSSVLIGEVGVNAEEGLARVATFSIRPTGSISVPTWVGKSVTIDFQQIDSNNVPLVSVRVFTGVVDIPNFDPTRDVVQFNCIDNLNGIIGQQPRVALDQLIDGWWSPFVFEADADSLQYANAQMLSVPKSLDLSAYQQPRVTDWAAKVTPDFTLTAADQVIDDSVSFQMANRSEIKNKVNLQMQYRFPRLRARRTGVQWSMPSLFSIMCVAQFFSFTIPTKQMVESAASGLSGGGWHVLGISYAEPPVSQFMCTPAVGWLCNNNIAGALAWACAVSLARRWVQTVTEVYPAEVISESSILALGEIAVDETTGMEVSASVFDFAGWEADLTRLPGPTYPIGIAHNANPYPRALAADTVYLFDTTGYGGDFSQDITDVPEHTRADQQYTLETTLNVAKTTILGSHRHSRLTCVAPLNPFVDLIHTVTIDTPRVTGKGKVAEINYTMNVPEGKATMTVSIAISGVGAVGVQPEDPLVAPPNPPPPVYTPPIAKSGQTKFGSDTGSTYPQPTASTHPIGYLGNRVNQGIGYDDGKAYIAEFRLQAPAVEDALTQPVTLEEPFVTYRVAVPEDTLILTG